jgi:hypothetical protein
MSPVTVASHGAAYLPILPLSASSLRFLKMAYACLRSSGAVRALVVNRIWFTFLRKA